MAAVAQSHCSPCSTWVNRCTDATSAATDQGETLSTVGACSPDFRWTASEARAHRSSSWTTASRPNHVRSNSSDHAGGTLRNMSRQLHLDGWAVRAAPRRSFTSVDARNVRWRDQILALDVIDRCTGGAERDETPALIQE